jgi:hypothetical protein
VTPSPADAAEPVAPRAAGAHKASRRVFATRCAAGFFGSGGAGRFCSQAFRFKVGDNVVDQDGERCSVVSVDAEDFEKPYELEYPNGSKFWAAESAIRRHKVLHFLSAADGSSRGDRFRLTRVGVQAAQAGAPTTKYKISETVKVRKAMLREPALRCAAGLACTDAAALCPLRRAARTTHSRSANACERGVWCRQRRTRRSCRSARAGRRCTRSGPGFSRAYLRIRAADRLDNGRRRSRCAAARTRRTPRPSSSAWPTSSASGCALRCERRRLRLCARVHLSAC